MHFQQDFMTNINIVAKEYYDDTHYSNNYNNLTENL